MGCWSETCGISNLPINSGDKVCLFVLGPSAHDGLAGEKIYVDDAFVPLGFPVLGLYDDYGGIDFIEENPLMEDYLKNEINMFLYDDMSDEFVPFSWSSIEEFLSSLTRHEIYVNVPRYRKMGIGYTTVSEYSKLDFMMVHYPLYSRLLQNVKERIPYSHDKEYGVLVSKKIEQCIYDCNDSRDEKNWFGIPIMKKFHDYFKYSTDSCWNCWDYFVNQLETDDVGKDNYVSIVNGITDYYVWGICLSLLRKGFHVYTGAGSQSCEYQLHKIVASFIFQACNDFVDVKKDEGYSEKEVLEETLYFF